MQLEKNLYPIEINGKNYERACKDTFYSQMYSYPTNVYHQPYGESTEYARITFFNSRKWVKADDQNPTIKVLEETLRAAADKERHTWIEHFGVLPVIEVKHSHERTTMKPAFTGHYWRSGKHKFCDKYCPFVVTEYIPNLMEWRLNEFGKNPNISLKDIADLLTRIMDIIEKNKFSHGTVTPQDILVNNNGRVDLPLFALPNRIALEPEYVIWRNKNERELLHYSADSIIDTALDSSIKFGSSASKVNLDIKAFSSIIYFLLKFRSDLEIKDKRIKSYIYQLRNERTKANNLFKRFFINTEQTIDHLAVWQSLKGELKKLSNT